MFGERELVFIARPFIVCNPLGARSLKTYVSCDTRMLLVAASNSALGTLSTSVLSHLLLMQMDGTNNMVGPQGPSMDICRTGCTKGSLG